MIPVKIRQEVIDFLRRLPPEPRHTLKVAIKGLAREKGDIRALTDDLEGFYRLRVGRYRVIFRYEIHGGARMIACVFAGPRNWIYEVFHGRIGG
jgi:mRNA interferase RelE/StbE